MAKKALLEDANHRHKCLAIIRQTGCYKTACESLGMTERSFQRFRESHPEFDEACHDAKANYRVMYQLRLGGTLREKAMRCLEQRIDSGEITDTALLKILYDDKYGDFL